MLTRKHFKAAAQIISSVKDDATRHQLAMDFSQHYKQENPQFNVEKFIHACESANN
jgi:hypothetical protein|tara:strand:+ start:393 stop:560 length:168 start_codon:yes stop_codon:yes gene_type:complete